MCLKEEIAKKWPQMKKKKKVFFHIDNALCHKVTGKTTWSVLQIASTPTLFSSSSSPNKYWLFADLKRMLQGKRFGSNEEVISETETYLEAKDKCSIKEALNCLRSMESVYHPRRRLCWWIKSNLTKKLLFY